MQQPHKTITKISLTVLCLGIIGFLTLYWLTPDKLRLDSEKTALLLIDVWEDPPTAEWQNHWSNDYEQLSAWWDTEIEKNKQEKILPLMSTAYYHNIPIFLSYSGGEPEKDTLLPLWEARVVDFPDELDNILKEQKIDTIIYAGYSLGMCILYDATGMIEMTRRGYKIILARDCSLYSPITQINDSDLPSLVGKAFKISMLEEIRWALERH